MHIGFSFKPKTLLIVLAVILGIVAYGVEAFADPLDEHTAPAAELLTDEPASDAGTDTSEVPAGSGTVVINTAPAAEAAAPETSAELIPALPPLCRVSSVSISLSWLPTVPVMSLPSPALPV